MELTELFEVIAAVIIAYVAGRVLGWRRGFNEGIATKLPTQRSGGALPTNLWSLAGFALQNPEVAKQAIPFLMKKFLGGGGGGGAT